MTHKNGPKEYQRLADKCRETARTVSAEKERGDLLAMAEIWDLIAGRVGRPPRSGEIGGRRCAVGPFRRR
jgi:hypothetical protein